MKDIPEDMPLDAEEFNKLDCTVLTGGPDDRLYCQLSLRFQEASAQFCEAEQFRQAKILKLFSDVCSVTWDHNRENACKPYDKASLCDFKDPEILDFLQYVVPEIRNHRLQGRIWDCLWLLPKKRKPEDAIQAIDGFAKILTTATNLSRDDKTCLDRALQLCKQIKKKDPGKLQSLEESLLQALMDAKVESGTAALGIHQLLHDHKLGTSHQKERLDKLVCLAGTFSDQGKFSTSCAYYKATREIVRRSSDNAKASEFSVKIAESLVAEADTWLASEADGKNLAAHRFICEAIQQYLQVPHKHRDNHKVDEQVTGLKQMLHLIAKVAADERETVSNDMVNLERVELSARLVQGKSLTLALKLLAGIHPTADLDQLKW